MKAQITIVELIVVVIALFVAFGIMFPGFVYKNKWKEANVLINSRDLVLAMDRTGKLYNCSFNRLALSEFLSLAIKENLIPWSEVEGTFPNQIIVACNCTEEEISKMNFWFNPLTINKRRIHLLFLKSKLEEIPIETDVLLIKGYRNLNGYSNIFRGYIARGVGLVEMMDFDSQEKVNDDEAQTQIFGIWWSGSLPGNADMEFSKPTSVENITYFPYKHFYHVPLPINISSNEVLSGCSYKPSGKGSLILNKTKYWFWICNDTYVWFDTNADGINDALVKLGDKFKINEFNFTLSYIHDNTSIAISFKPNYIFSDYFSYEQGGNKYIANITPIDNKKERVFLKTEGEEIPSVILGSSRVAWMYDFGNEPSDEEKNLLLSLLLWASGKKSTVLISPVKAGFSTSYINLQNVDIFEVYKFNLGLSYPY